MKSSKSRGQLLYVSNHGRVQNYSGLRYFPAPNALGYCVVIKKTTSRTSVHVCVHRAVHVLFNDPELKSWFIGATVDHIDRIRCNNNASNLRWATRVLQRVNQDHKPRNHACRRIRIFNGSESRDFNSCSEAANYIGCHASLFSRQSTVHGWSFKHLEDSNLDGEEWRPCADGCSSKVSSLGRVETIGRKRMPTPDVDGYCWVGSTPFAHAVLIAFGYPRPSSAHTADHIDRDRSNNALSNLRWADAKQQASNRSPAKTRVGVHARESRPATSSIWTRYNNPSELYAATGVSRAGMNNCTNPASRQKTAPGNDGIRYEIRRVVDPSQRDIDGEEWKILHIADWMEDGKYHNLSETTSVASSSSMPTQSPIPGDTRCESPSLDRLPAKPM